MADDETAARGRQAVPVKDWLTLDVRIALLLMRVLARGRCYHCHAASPATLTNNRGLRYCADHAACDARMTARGKQNDPGLTAMRELLGEANRG